MHLNSLKKGERCLVTQMPEEIAARNFLLVNGFFVGAEVQVNANDSLRQLLHLSVGGRFLAMRKADAERISVQKLEA